MQVRRVAAALSAVLLAGLLAGCGQGGNEVHVTEIPNSATAAPTTTVPDPTYAATIATGLKVPWGLAFLPDGDAIVTERDTRHVVLLKGAKHTKVDLGVLGPVVPSGEGGLLGVAVSPSFAEDHLLYFYLSTRTDNRVVGVAYRNGRLGKPTVLLEGIPVGDHHDGGRLAFGPDGDLYVSTGETGDGSLSQDLDSLGGKILRLAPDGKPAPGNPYGTYVYSYGHRNVQGLAFVGGQLWASEFGQDKADELNRIEPGEDYGWPEVEGTGGTGRGFVDPQLTWDPDTASPSGLAALNGYLWMGALQGERLWRVSVDQPGLVASDPVAFFIGDFGRLRTVTVAPDGTLWVTTSNEDGRGDPHPGDDKILQITP